MDIIAWLRAFADGKTPEDVARIEEAAAEITRLREALQEIETSADKYTTGEGHARCAQIARAALKETNNDH